MRSTNSASMVKRWSVRLTGEGMFLNLRLLSSGRGAVVDSMTGFVLLELGRAYGRRSAWRLETERNRLYEGIDRLSVIVNITIPFF